ncbi:MAG: hypothetical protein ACPGU5_04815 [Lishizhenia sp.]
MRYIIFSLLCWSAYFGYAQTNNFTQGNQFFAQIQIDSSNPTVVDNVVNAMKTNPNVFIVRYDAITNGLLFVTESISSFDEAIMISWFEGNEHIIECFQYGIQGLDKHIAFGTDFCNQVN